MYHHHHHRHHHHISIITGSWVWCPVPISLNVSANLENSAVATGLEKVSFHSNPKERQCQRMLKLPHNCAHRTMNFQMFKLDLEKAEEPEIKWSTSAGSWKKQESSRKTSTSALLTMPKPLTMWITTNWKLLEHMGKPDHLTCILRNLYAVQEETVRSRHGKMNWFQIGKGLQSRLYIFTLLIYLICKIYHAKCWVG